MLSNGHWPDLIDLWLDYTEGTPSPVIFRLWSGISLVAGALERRVWAAYGDLVTYPNLYVLLVAHPGIGKGIIEDVRDIWQSTKLPDSKLPAFHVASDSITRASLVDELGGAKQVRLTSEGPPLTYHCLLIPSEEFQVLLPSYNPEFVGVLNGLWMNKELHKEKRRTSIVKELIIEKPTLNILAGTQPAYLANAFPEEVWNTGIARRLFMIFAGERPIFDIFAKGHKTPDRRSALILRLSQLAALHGPVFWEPAVEKAVRDWHLAGGPPVPAHSRLLHYVQSRTLVLVKLMVIAALAARGELVVRLEDHTRAMGWLLEAEKLMPDIFRAMLGKSDIQVINEIHEYVFAMWSKDRQKPVPGTLIRAFMLDRVPQDKTEIILAGAERANVIARVAGTQDSWIPKVRPGQVE